MKKALIVLTALFFVIFLFACSKNLPAEPPYPSPDKRLRITIVVDTGNFVMLLEKITDQGPIIVSDANVLANDINIPYNGGGLYNKYIGILTPGSIATVNVSSSIGNFFVSGIVPEHDAEILIKYKEEISGCNLCDSITYFEIINGVPPGF